MPHNRLIFRQISKPGCSILSTLVLLNPCLSATSTARPLNAPHQDTKHPSVVSAAAKTVFQTPNTPPRCLQRPLPPLPALLELRPLNFNHLLQTPATQTKQAFKEIHCVSTLYAPDFRQNRPPGTKRSSLTSGNIDKNSII